MKHITLEQRCTISALQQNGYSQVEIAIRVETSESTVSRELKRNKDNRNGCYKPVLAQRKYQDRQKAKAKNVRYREDIKLFVAQGLAKDYSPEQIVGRAKLDGVACVSHERIYQEIWLDKKSGGTMYTYLRRQGRKYANRCASKGSRGIIKNRIDIDQRPAIVDEKIRFGDFEADTIIGKNHKGALLTLNDRASSKVFIRLLTGKESVPVTQKITETLSPIKEMLHTITSDNGKEFAGHETISKELGIDFYFAKPYHSWERGANENTNGLIRQYFKKGTSFENITNADVERVESILNNRPRKRLGFLTPNEFFILNFKN